VKFKDADLIGIPWRIVVGRDASNDQVELVRRANKETQLLNTEQVIDSLTKEINTQLKRGI
jgi:prolyl-tRNA synthetase